MTEPNTDGPKCGVCGDQSGGEFVGVAAVPGAPVSVGWCRLCLVENAVPAFVVRTWLFSEFWQDDKPIPKRPPEDTGFAEWVKAFKVWIDGRYVPFTEAVPILWEKEKSEETTA